MADNKYKIFRNFMVNELGISREDIKEWTMQAVAETVEKQLRGFDFEPVVTRAINERAYNVVDHELRRVLGNYVNDKLRIKIEEKNNA